MMVWMFVLEVRLIVKIFWKFNGERYESGIFNYKLKAEDNPNKLNLKEAVEKKNRQEGKNVL